MKCFPKSATINASNRDVFELHFSNDVYSQFDENCNGKLDPEEIAKFEAAARATIAPGNLKRPHELDSLNLRIAARGSVPVSEVVPPTTEKKTDEPEQRLFLRKDRVNVGFANKIPSYKDADGASLSIVRDYDKKETIVNAQGILTYVLLRNLEVARPNNNTLGYLSGYAFSPFVQIDSSTTSKSDTPTKDKLVFGGLGQFEWFGGPIFNRQLVQVSGYYQTDFFGDSEIYGAQASWEPELLTWGLGARARLTEFLDYTFRVIGETDYREVRAAGRTSLNAGQDYLWYGGQLILKVWPFPDMLNSRLYLQATQKYHRDATNSEVARLFTASIGYSLDPDGHAALQATYTSGKDYATGIKSEKLVGELVVKY
jgi:hypothetical protein